tara:strand:+ start:699 stop:917 length:219 start_codon:yes stop_codon:yes gene_type:complete
LELEPPPKSYFVWREFSSKNTNKLLERKEREKRKEERERRESSSLQKKRKKTDEKTLCPLPSASSAFFLRAK